MIEQLRIRQLRLIVEVADCASLIAAATRLNISQPAATKALKQIEQILGVRLVDRSKTGSSLTPAGRLVYDRAKRILGDTRSVELELKELLTGDAGRAIVGALPVALPALMPAALKKLSVRHPGLVVRLIAGDSGFLLEMLRSEQIDLLVGRLWSGEDPSFDYVPLYSTDFVLIARVGHPLFDIARPTLSDILSYRWILPPIGSHGRGAIDSIYRGAELAAPDCTVETTSHMVIRELLRDTDMIAPVDRSAVAKDAQDSVLRAVDINLNIMIPPLGIMMLKHRVAMHTTERVKRALIDATAEIVDGFT